MMKRGAHLSFVHFWGGGARPGESSLHVAREMVRKLAPWQFSAKLHLVPFEPVQREIVARAPEGVRVLLYRRMMLRIAERIARSGHAWTRDRGQPRASRFANAPQHGRGRRRHESAALPATRRRRQARNLGASEKDRHVRHLRRALP